MSFTRKAVALCFALTAPGLVQADYPDVPSSHWAHEAVIKVSMGGLMRGRVDGNFHGSRPASRYDVAVAIAKVVAQIENAWTARGQNPEELVPYIEQINLYVADELDRLKQGQRELKAWVHETKERLAAIEEGRMHSAGIAPAGRRHASAGAGKSVQTGSKVEGAGTQVAGKRKKGASISRWISNVLGIDPDPPEADIARGGYVKPPVTTVTDSSTMGAQVVSPLAPVETSAPVPIVRDTSDVGFLTGQPIQPARPDSYYESLVSGAADPLFRNEAVQQQASVEEAKVPPAPIQAIRSVSESDFADQPRVPDTVEGITGALNLSSRSMSILEQLRARRAP